MNDKTKVIVTVDDFGPRSEVNERAFELIETNLATRVSAIVNIPWPALTAVRLKKDHIPVGLHLNISSGSSFEPIDRVPSLIDCNGQFLSENKSRNLSHICSADIARELRAQLHYFKSMCLSQSHLDNHRPEIYFYTKLLDCALNLAKLENVSFRHLLRNFSAENMKDLAQKHHYQEIDILRLKTHYDDALRFRRVNCPDFFISDESVGSLEKALEAIHQKNIVGYCEIAVHLEGDLGKANFDFIISEGFQAWNRYIHFVKPSEWVVTSR